MSVYNHTGRALARRSTPGLPASTNLISQNMTVLDYSFA